MLCTGLLYLIIRSGKSLLEYNDQLPTDQLNVKEKFCVKFMYGLITKIILQPTCLFATFFRCEENQRPPFAGKMIEKHKHQFLLPSHERPPNLHSSKKRELDRLK